MRRVILVAASMVFAAACGAGPTSPSQSNSPVVVSGAAATAPAVGTVIPFASQPVALLATLPTTTPPTAFTPFVDVATDATFNNIVQTLPVPGNPADSVQVTLSSLSPGTYYWRVRSVVSATVNLSSSSSFVVGSTTALPAPQLYTADNITVYPRPQLTVNRIAGARRPAGQIQYRFEVALTPGFLPVLRSTTVSEDPDTGSYSMYFDDDDLPLGTVFHWRVTAVDTATNASSYSVVRRFTTTPATINGQPSLLLTRDCRNSPTVAIPHLFTRVFDGTATVSDTSILFTATDSLVLSLNRSGSTVRGTINGRARERLGNYEAIVGPSYGEFAVPVPTSGAATATSAEGTYDGYLEFYLPLDPGNGCVANGVRWKLYLR